jgi:hypothetical protein
MDLYERLHRADELRKEAAQLRSVFYQRDKLDYNDYEWTHSIALDREADELDGTAARRKREDEANQAAHEARMALYHEYPPEVRAKQKRERLNQVIKDMDALLKWRHENLDPMYAYNAGTQGAQ